jgi:hypothetical protein
MSKKPLIEVQVNKFKYRDAKMAFLVTIKEMARRGDLYNAAIFKVVEAGLLCFIETCSEKATYYITLYSRKNLGTLYAFALCEEHFKIYNSI